MNLPPLSTNQAAALEAIFGRVNPIAREQPAHEAAASDRVEISAAAARMNRLSTLPDVRHELIERVRGEIAAGQYETPERLDQALDQLAQDLFD